MSCTHDCGCSAETRDARTDDWGHTSPLSPQNADLREFQPAEPSQPLGDVPASERPREAVLPRPITPEDVRVGMVVERRRGEVAFRDRVRSADVRIDGTVANLWKPVHATVGWSIWLIEDAPEPVDPDSADRQCAWADYRKDYGVGESEMEAAHKAFMAGWKSAREGDQSGPLR